MLPSRYGHHNLLCRQITLNFEIDFNVYLAINERRGSNDYILALLDEPDMFWYEWQLPQLLCHVLKKVPANHKRKEKIGDHPR